MRLRPVSRDAISKRSPSPPGRRSERPWLLGRQRRRRRSAPRRQALSAVFRRRAMGHQFLHHRRHHRSFGRLQGARQLWRLPELVWVPAQHQGRDADLRLLPRHGPGHQDPRLRDRLRGAAGQSSGVQRGRRTRPDHGACCDPHRHGLLAEIPELLSTGLHRQRRHDVHGIHPHGPANHRLLRSHLRI